MNNLVGGVLWDQIYDADGVLYALTNSRMDRKAFSEIRVGGLLREELPDKVDGLPVLADGLCRDHEATLLVQADATQIPHLRDGKEG